MVQNIEYLFLELSQHATYSRIYAKKCWILCNVANSWVRIQYARTTDTSVTNKNNIFRCYWTEHITYAHLIYHSYDPQYVYSDIDDVISAGVPVAWQTKINNLFERLIFCESSSAFEICNRDWEYTILISETSTSVICYW